MEILQTSDVAHEEVSQRDGGAHLADFAVVVFHSWFLCSSLLISAPSSHQADTNQTRWLGSDGHVQQCQWKVISTSLCSLAHLHLSFKAFCSESLLLTLPVNGLLSHVSVRKVGWCVLCSLSFRKEINNRAADLGMTPVTHVHRHSHCPERTKHAGQWREGTGSPGSYTWTTLAWNKPDGFTQRFEVNSLIGLRSLFLNGWLVQLHKKLTSGLLSNIEFEFSSSATSKNVLETKNKVKSRQQQLINENLNCKENNKSTGRQSNKLNNQKMNQHKKIKETKVKLKPGVWGEEQNLMNQLTAPVMSH